MLGWHVSVCKQSQGGDKPPEFATPVGARLAVWQTNWMGLDWLHKLVEQSRALDLGGNGYPNRFTAPARTIGPVLLDGPPHANLRWVSDADDITGPDWEGRTTLDHEAIRRCDPAHWLVIVSWDES